MHQLAVRAFGLHQFARRRKRVLVELDGVAPRRRQTRCGESWLTPRDVCWSMMSLLGLLSGLLVGSLLGEEGKQKGAYLRIAQEQAAPGHQAEVEAEEQMAEQVGCRRADESPWRRRNSRSADIAPMTAVRGQA